MTQALFLLRTFFQFFAFAFFIFQMQQAFNKYASKPKVRETSMERLNEIQKPLMYICQEDQFNYTKAKQMGYESNSGYLSGLLNGTEATSWMGNTNINPDKVLKSLYEYDYSDLEILVGGEPKNITEVFVLPYGFCMVIQNLTELMNLEIHANHTMKFLILDPYQSTNFRAEQILGKSIQLKGHEKTGLFEFSWHKVSYTLFDETIKDGESCKDYDKVGSSYGECVEKAVEDKLQDFYGCIPFWFPGNTTKCSKGLKEKNDSAVIFLIRLNSNLDLQTNCKPPCMSLRISLDLLSKNSNFPNHSVLNILHDQEVIKHKLMLSYDAFSLIVELGM